jgi:integrase
MRRIKLVIFPKLHDYSGDMSKQWIVYFSCRDPKSGKMRRFRHYDGLSVADPELRYRKAEEMIRHFTNQLQGGWLPFEQESVMYSDSLQYKTVAELFDRRKAGNRTFRVWVSRFLERTEPAVSKATYQTYQSKYRIFSLWLDRVGLADNDLSTIDQPILSDFIKFLINSRGLSGNSIKKYKHCLKAFFDFAADNKIMLVNPVYNLPVSTRVNDMAARPINRADVEIFLKEIKQDRVLWLAIQLEYYCALRPGYELRLLRIKDIDLTSGLIRVDRNRAKSRKERMVTVPRQLLIQLRSLNLQSYNREFYLFGKGDVPGPVVIGKNNLRYRFNRVRTLLNMPEEYKLYSWKHTSAIEADECGIPFKDVSMQLGHSSLKSKR